LKSLVFLGSLAALFTQINVTTPAISDWIALFIASFMLIVSGFASASEIAFFSLSPTDLNSIEEDIHSSDPIIKRLLGDSERLLATILVTNNFVNVLIILLYDYFFSQVFDFGGSELAEFLVLTVLLTFLLLLFGEIMPKIFSAQNRLRFCRIAAPGILFCSKIFYPISELLVRSTFFINRRLRGNKRTLSVDDLSQALELTNKEDIQEENQILEGIVRFGNESVNEVMTARLDMIDLDIRAPFKEVLNLIVRHSYSRIPVYSETRDNIKGVLYIKDLLPHINKGADFRWQSLVRQAFFVPDSKMIDSLLRDFQANKVHMAIVVDEFGGTCGLVTMEDIIEEIVGEISDEYDEEERIYTQINENTWVFRAKILLSDFYRITSIDEFDESVEGDADTLGGLLLEMKGDFPELHEVISYNGYRFDILEIDDRRILKIKFTKLKT